jgi:four helix bundle protein
MDRRQVPFETLRGRTKRFALMIIKALQGIKWTPESEVLKKQIIRSATSVGANYRSACRARSQADFISKLKISLEEADETQYWLELFFELKLIEEEVYTELYKEADELIAIFVTSAKTAERKKQ